MAFNGSGVFVRLYNWVNDAASSIKIRADRMDNEMDGFATGLSTCITKNGQTTITANLPMATYRHTGVGDGQSRTDYCALGQSQDGKLNWVDGGGTADAITATYAIPLTSIVDGQLCFVRATAANATTTPTFSPNGLTARTIVKNGGQALEAGDIAGDGHELILRYDLTNTRWELLNPKISASLVTETGTQTLTNKTLSDSTTYFVDNADTTKKLQLQCSGITTGTTRTMTVPDDNFTVVGADTTQTLTNKTITAANIKTFTVTLADDTATSFTPTTSGGEGRGIILIKSSTENACAGIGWYNCAAGGMASFFAQADLNILATNTTLAGTTSTDAKFNISAASDGKIYLENRRGGSETYEVTIF